MNRLRLTEWAAIGEIVGTIGGVVRPLSVVSTASMPIDGLTSDARFFTPAD